MWSIIDLAPLDVDIDEKQENLDLLVENLKELGEYYPDALEKTYKGVSGYIYCAESITDSGFEIKIPKGFAFDAMVQMLEYAAKKGYKIILDQVRKDNLASIRLHKKLGFESDGYVYLNEKNIDVLLYLKLL